MYRCLMIEVIAGWIIRTYAANNPAAGQPITERRYRIPSAAYAHQGADPAYRNAATAASRQSPAAESQDAQRKPCFRLLLLLVAVTHTGHIIRHHEHAEANGDIGEGGRAFTIDLQAAFHPRVAIVNAADDRPQTTERNQPNRVAGDCTSGYYDSALPQPRQSAQ